MNPPQPNPNQVFPKQFGSKLNDFAWGNREITVEIDELRVDSDALSGSADALASDVGIALERLIAERGLPARASTAATDTPSPRDDAALAAHVAESVWRQLVRP